MRPPALEIRGMCGTNMDVSSSGADDEDGKICGDDTHMRKLLGSFC